MTLAELVRFIESYKRRERNRQRERALYDYTLANLIGRSVARIYNSSNTYPDISEVYPNLFESEELEEQKQKQKDILSALRFKQFADAFNKKFKGGAQSE